MSTHPFIPLYVDDYDAATAHLTLEEDGVYSRLIRLCWRTPGCSLPNDLPWIARKIRVPASDADRILAPVLSEFFRLQRGRLVQKRLKAEYDDISRKKSARKTAGKKGGDAKARKTQDNEASNASDLPADTRAFPEPYPEPEPEVIEPSSSEARGRLWMDRLEQAKAEAGDMADFTRPAMHHAADLRALVEPVSGEPCTWDEVLVAIAMTAMRQRPRKKLIQSWSWVRDDALALRDKRLNAANPDVAEVVELRPAGPASAITDRIAAERAEARRRVLEG